MTDLAAADLYQHLGEAVPPHVLDVRNVEEFARWRVEGPHPVDVLNVPYFEFVEREEASVKRVTDWLGSRAGDLVVVCAEGGSSAYVAEILQGRGLPAANLAGGMVAWGLGTAIRPIAASGPARLWQVLRFGRGCLSYVVARGEDAVVVDPHRGLDAYRGLLAREGLRLRAVFDTHLHADHVSGGPALARDAGVGYHASLRDFEGGAVPVEGLVDGQPVRIGRLEVLPIVPLGTPGHTPGSTSLLVADALLLTGDTLFVDDVGRPDLGGQAAAWARDLYRTLHERLQPLGDAIVVLPAHASTLAASGPQPTLKGKRLKERLFSLMTPSRLNRMPVSKMNFGGVGRVMLQSMMRDKQVASIDELFDMARQLGVKLIACTMSMDVMGIAREELIDGVEVGGVATFLGDAARSRVSLFV